MARLADWRTYTCSVSPPIRLQKPVELAVDLRVQHALRDELMAARDAGVKVAAAGLVTDHQDQQIVTRTTIQAIRARRSTRPSSRLTTGVFEMGSTFKALTVAMAIDSGKVSLSSSFDARMPLRYGRFSIDDYHARSAF